MLSVPTVRTRRKQNGKSRTLRPRYTPTADQPYSRDSFLSLALSDRLPVDSFGADCAALRALEAWKVRRAVAARRDLGFALVANALEA